MQTSLYGTDETSIDKIFKDLLELKIILQEKNDISLLSSIMSMMTKGLLIAAASYFESIICETLLNHAASELSSREHGLVEFIKNKAIKRQYHTFFSWDAANANKFFSLFGDKYREKMVEKTKRDSEFNKGTVSFLQLGSLRNELTHNDFGSYSIQATSEEIYQLYKDAKTFVNTSITELKAYNKECMRVP
jgi:hypothetical protein